MINENLPKGGDTVYVRDVDDYNASEFKKWKFISILLVLQ